MTTYRESDAVFSYHFYRILQRAENVNILHNTESDDFGSGEKSRFITQLLSEYKGRINEFVFGGEELEFTDDKEIIIKNFSLQKEIENWSKYVSPSSLNKYINCSLSFYYHYLAKIRKEDEVSEFAEANNIGTAIHEALNKIYPKGVITSQSVNQIKEDLLRKVEEEFIQEMKGEDVSKGKNYLSLEISKKLAQNFVEFEERLLKKLNSRGGTLNILESEGEFEHQLQVNQKPFTIKGKVDRVDEMNNQLWINQGDATFIDDAIVSGVAVDSALGEASAGIVERQTLLNGINSLLDQQTQIFQTMMYLGLLFTVVVMFNTMIMNVAERDFELATLRVLGASTRSLGTMLLFESLLIGIIGGIVGVLFAYGGAVGLAASFSSWQFFVPVTIVPSVAWQLMSGVILIAVAMTPFGVWRLRKMDLVEKVKDLSS